MNTLIETEIKKFEALQEKYSDFGAEDSEPDAVFQMIIAHAITKDPIEVDEPIDWDLYEDDNADHAATELTQQAWVVYKTIQKHASDQDITELKKYCWRLDEAEFTSFLD